MRQEEFAEDEEEDKQPGEYGKPDEPRVLALPDHCSQANDTGSQSTQQHGDAVKDQQRPPRQVSRHSPEHRSADDIQYYVRGCQSNRPPTGACAGPPQEALPQWLIRRGNTVWKTRNRVHLISPLTTYSRYFMTSSTILVYRTSSIHAISFPLIYQLEVI